MDITIHDSSGERRVPDISAMTGKPYIDPNPSEDAIRRSTAMPFGIRPPLVMCAENDPLLPGKREILYESPHARVFRVGKAVWFEKIGHEPLTEWEAETIAVVYARATGQA